VARRHILHDIETRGWKHTKPYKQDGASIKPDKGDDENSVKRLVADECATQEEAVDLPACTLDDACMCSDVATPVNVETVVETYETPATSAVKNGFVELVCDTPEVPVCASEASLDKPLSSAAACDESAVKATDNVCEHPQEVKQSAVAKQKKRREKKSVIADAEKDAT